SGTNLGIQRSHRGRRSSGCSTLVRMRWPATATLSSLESLGEGARAPDAGRELLGEDRGSGISEIRRAAREEISRAVLEWPLASAFMECSFGSVRSGVEAETPPASRPAGARSPGDGEGSCGRAALDYASSPPSTELQ